MDPEKSLENGKIHEDNPATTGLSLSDEELERILKTGAGGLNQTEVQVRLQEYGFNDIPEEKKHPLLRFFRYFWGPIPWMIEVAALLSAIIQQAVVRIGNYLIVLAVSLVSVVFIISIIRGVPVEELMFACAFGFYWSTVYERFTWKKVPDHYIPGY